MYKLLAKKLLVKRTVIEKTKSCASPRDRASGVSLRGEAGTICGSISVNGYARMPGLRRTKAAVQAGPAAGTLVKTARGTRIPAPDRPFSAVSE